MSDDIHFDEDRSFLYSRLDKGNVAPKMVRFLVDKGWVKDEKTAGTVLLSVAAIILIISIFVWASVFGGSASVDKLDPDPLTPGSQQ